MDAFAWSGDGRTIAATRPEDQVSVIDVATGKERKRFPVYTGPVPPDVKSFFWAQQSHSIRGLALSPNGTRLAASVFNGEFVAVWDTETGKAGTRLKHDFPVNQVLFTPDGKSVITFGTTGIGYRWDIDKVIVAQKR